MKRLVNYLLLLLILLFALSGCGSTSLDNNSSDETNYLKEIGATYSANKDDWEIEKIEINSDHDQQRELPNKNKEENDTNTQDDEVAEEDEIESTPEEDAIEPAPVEESEGEVDPEKLFTVILDDVSYQLPISYSKLKEDGWTLSDNSYLETTEFEANKAKSVSFSKNEKVVKAWIVNNSENTKVLKDCMIGGFVVTKGKIQDTSLFKLYNGITVDYSVGDIIKVMGEPSTRSKGEGSKKYESLDYSYTKTYSKFVTFTIYPDEEEDSKIDIRNFAPEESR